MREPAWRTRRRLLLLQWPNFWLMSRFKTSKSMRRPSWSTSVRLFPRDRYGRSISSEYGFRSGGMTSPLPLPMRRWGMHGSGVSPLSRLSFPPYTYPWTHRSGTYSLTRCIQPFHASLSKSDDSHTTIGSWLLTDQLRSPAVEAAEVVGRCARTGLTVLSRVVAAVAPYRRRVDRTGRQSQHSGYKNDNADIAFEHPLPLRGRRGR